LNPDGPAWVYARRFETRPQRTTGGKINRIEKKGGGGNLLAVLPIEWFGERLTVGVKRNTFFVQEKKKKILWKKTIAAGQKEKKKTHRSPSGQKL